MKIIDTEEFRGKKYDVIEDKSVSKPCYCCDLQGEFCDLYIDTNLCMACGAEFNNNNIYLKEQNGE